MNRKTPVSSSRTESQKTLNTVENDISKDNDASISKLEQIQKKHAEAKLHSDPNTESEEHQSSMMDHHMNNSKKNICSNRYYLRVENEDNESITNEQDHQQEKRNESSIQISEEHQLNAEPSATISQLIAPNNQYRQEVDTHDNHPYEETILDYLDDVLDVFNENVLPTMLRTEHQLRHARYPPSATTRSFSEDAPSHSMVGDSTDVVVHEVSFSSSSSLESCCEDVTYISPSNLQLVEETSKNEIKGETLREDQAKPSKGTNRKQIVNLILFLLGTMCFKFSYETLSGAIGLTILTRLEGHPVGATTILSLLTITFGISQSISSTLVEGLLKSIRATRLYSMALLLFASLIITMIVLEATTGGTLSQAGYWSPWLIFPIYIFIGFNIGVIEVVRKVIPASILGNTETSTLKRLNASIHIIYEVAGTVGAFLSSVFIEKLGSIYALCHMPLFFTFGAIFLFFISSKNAITEEQECSDKFDLSPPTERFILLRKFGVAVKNYFKSMFIGAKIVLSNRYYIWLIPCFVLPQTLHRLIENIFLPAYAKMILKKGSYSGIMLGGSNFGELLGAGLLFLLAKKVKKPTIWIILDAVFLNLMWIFPFLTFDEKTDNNLIFAICIVPAMVLTSGSYAAGDCTQVAYIQSTISDEVNEETGVNELAAVMSFLYSCYIIITTFIVFGLSQGLDRFNTEKRPELGFMTICILLTVLSFIICALYLLFAKIKPTPEEEELERKNQEMQVLSGVVSNATQYQENSNHLQHVNV